MRFGHDSHDCIKKNSCSSTNNKVTTRIKPWEKNNSKALSTSKESNLKVNISKTKYTLLVMDWCWNGSWDVENRVSLWIKIIKIVNSCHD